MNETHINNIPSRTTRILLFISIILLMTSPAFALGEGRRNLLLIAYMGLSPLVLLLYPVLKGKVDFPIVFYLLLTFFCPMILHPETMRQSTMLYTAMYGVFFIALTRLFDFSQVDENDIARLLKGLIFAYFAVLIIQQFCVLTGLPIFNKGNWSPLNPWRLNSLMSEPEHSSRMMAIMMYSYLTMREICRGEISFKDFWEEDRPLWLAFLWSMFTTLSAGAYFFLAIVLTKVFRGRSIFYVSLLIGALVVVVTLFIDANPFMRVINLIKSVFTFDTALMYRADHSGALRFAPGIECLKQIDLSTLDGWFGHGVDFTKGILYRIIPGVAKGYVNGGFFQYVVDFGFLPFLVISAFTFWCCYDSFNKIPTLLFWIFFVLFTGANLQLTWATVFLLYMAKCLKKRKESLLETIEEYDDNNK